MINVTKTYLPPLKTYEKYLEKIWKSSWVTNNGPFVNDLEKQLKSFLGVKHLFLVNNGTIALQIALRALDISGEVITTPFSYVATTSAIVWEGSKPVFADIDKATLNLDPKQVARVITKKTSCILATHVYGNPCDVESFAALAKRKKIKIIYDAAHAFGVKYKGKSLLGYGDIATVSFHATKLFHTIEGGALVTNDDEVAQKIAWMRNFGHATQESFYGVGINGKVSEFHAAMGLCVLPELKNIIKKRKTITGIYHKRIKKNIVSYPQIRSETQYNYSYLPVLFESEDVLLKVKSSLEARLINTRRYFNPSLNELDYVSPKRKMPIAQDTAKRVLCLPLYYDLTQEEVELICDIINDAILI